jgi:methionyl-tRNA formyltransferase
MRVIFAGTPEFARIALEKLHASGHTIALVLTQPDRPAGRGMKLGTSVVKDYALAHGLPLAQPRSLRLDGKYPQDAAQARQAIADAQAEVMVVAAYGLILPQWVLDAMAHQDAGSAVDRGDAANARYGCLNIHGSLLPRWRGAAPIHRAIEAGDSETGVTIMQMDAGLDTGDMLLCHTIALDASATTASVHDQLAHLGADLIVQALDLAVAGRLTARKQPDAGITYAHKVEKSEATINWKQDAAAIVRQVRAFNPFPVATSTLHGEVIKIWAAHVAVQAPPQADLESKNTKYGQIMALAVEFIAVSAINSIVNITELQRPGGKRLPVAEFLRGYPLQVGWEFGQ